MGAVVGDVRIGRCGNDDDDNIYYDEVCVCVFVLKNHNFPLPS